MPYVNQPAPNRSYQQKPKFITYVVEGEKNDNPGMVRVIRFDKDGGYQNWLSCDWGNYADEMGVVHPRGRLTAYKIDPDMEELGAFLLQDEYERIGRKDVFEAYDRYERTHEPGQYFPREMLPPRVLKLQALQTKREGEIWEMPDGLSPIDDDDDGPTLAGNLDEIGPEQKPRARTSGRKAP